MNEEVELVPMEDGKFYMKLEDVNKSIEVATFKLQQENQSLKEENKKLKQIIKVYENPNDVTGMFMYCDELKPLQEILKGDK